MCDGRKMKKRSVTFTYPTLPSYILEKEFLFYFERKQTIKNFIIVLLWKKTNNWEFHISPYQWVENDG